MQVEDLRTQKRVTKFQTSSIQYHNSGNTNPADIQTPLMCTLQNNLLRYVCLRLVIDFMVWHHSEVMWMTLEVGILFLAFHIAPTVSDAKPRHI
ncbi:hypothetical protein TNCV_205651 [Trichonephila clavipes]|nr:hypothetical protein TNCV_205651 [Trichonephila clavipes]